MPKPTGFSKKASLISYLKREPGYYFTGALAEKFDMTPGAVSGVMAELAGMYPAYVKKIQRGSWKVDFSEWLARVRREQADAAAARTKKRGG